MTDSLQNNTMEQKINGQNLQQSNQGTVEKVSQSIGTNQQKKQQIKKSQKTFKPVEQDTFYKKYQVKVQQKKNHRKKQINKWDLGIHRELPFVLKVEDPVSVGEQNRVYKCEFKDNKNEFQALQTLKVMKDQYQQIQGQIIHYVTDEVFDKVYSKAVFSLNLQQNKTIKSNFHNLIQPLKCKIIKLKGMHSQMNKEIESYLQKLKLHYLYKDSIKSKHSIISNKIKQHKEKFKLFYFKLFSTEVLDCKTIEYFLKKHQILLSGNNLQALDDEDLKKIKGQDVILKVAGYINHRTQKKRSIAFKLIQQALPLYEVSLTFPAVQKLLTMIQGKYSTKRYAEKLLKIYLAKLLERQIQIDPEQLKQTKNDYQKQKQLDQKFLICQSLIDPKQAEKKKSSFNIEMTNIQNNIPYKMDKQLQKKKKKEQIQRFNNEKKNVIRQYILKNKSQLQENLVFRKSKTNVTFQQMKELLKEIHISNLDFASTLDENLNQNLQQYIEFVQKAREKQQFGNKKERKANQTDQVTQEFMYVVNQFHRGKTLKQLVLKNWKGFQNHQIVLDLAMKLLWQIVQLQYSQFAEFIPTLQNVIIDDNMRKSDLNFNMTSFLVLVNFNLSNPNSQKYQLQELLPFLWQNQANEISTEKLSINRQELQDKNSKQTKQKTDLNSKHSLTLHPIKHFLSILLFIICRRLDFFETSSTIFQTLKKIIQNDIAKIKSPDNKQPNFKGKQQKSIIKLQQLNLQLILNSLNSDKPFDKMQKKDFFALQKYLPKIYETYLSKYQLPQKDVKHYEKISYQNSNPYRINEFQRHLGLQNNHLYQIFFNCLAKNNQENKTMISWRKIFSALFTKGNEIEITQSKLLIALCDIFDYSIVNPEKINWIPPEIYFALKYDIDFSQFQKKYHGKWFDCFEINNQLQENEYDIGVVNLLKTIQSQIVGIANSQVQKIIKFCQQNGCLKLNTIIKEEITQQKKQVCRKLQCTINLLKYLNRYEKKLYVRYLVKKDRSNKIREKNKQKETIEVHLQYLTDDYFLSCSEQDIEELQQTLMLFRSFICLDQGQKFKQITENKEE